MNDLEGDKRDFLGSNPHIRINVSGFCVQPTLIILTSREVKSGLDVVLAPLPLLCTIRPNKCSLTYTLPLNFVKNMKTRLRVWLTACIASIFSVLHTHISRASIFISLVSCPHFAVNSIHRSLFHTRNHSLSRNRLHIAGKWTLLLLKATIDLISVLLTALVIWI